MCTISYNGYIAPLVHFAIRSRLEKKRKLRILLSEAGIKGGNWV